MQNDSPSEMLRDRSTCVLLVVADEALSQRACLDLQEVGYNPVLAGDIHSGCERVRQNAVELVVVDQALGNESGLDFCRQLRFLGYSGPALLFMAHDTVSERVACLEAGADDYCLKPYRTETFVNLVRLYLKPNNQGGEHLRFGDLTLDLSNRKAIRNGQEIDLTAKEYELLKYLMEHPGEVLTREQILEQVWGHHFTGESNVIEVYVRYLRLKLESEGQKRLIQTVRGVGYALREN